MGWQVTFVYLPAQAQRSSLRYFTENWRGPMQNLSGLTVRTALLSTAMLAGAAQAAVTVIVPGNSNPNLAGRADGYACCSGDAAPTESPVTVAGLALNAGDVLTFTVTGSVYNAPGSPTGNMGDGTPYGDVMANYGDGLAAPSGLDRINALVGVYLGPGSPTGTATPARLSFAGGLAFASLAPEVGQIFFIGNGLTGDTYSGDQGGQAQQFTVPTGATRLILGTSDGFGWYNNSGAFNVSITAVP